jgi:prephenate dehydrogenase
MAQSRIAIIGTGLIGTSLGLALNQRKDRNYEIVGVDRDRGHSREAKKMGALDREVSSLEEALTGSGLVVIAVPVLAAKRILQDMVPYLEPNAIVTDTCSTKADILRWAAEFLPENIHFVGGHPMAGREHSGPGAATPDLFQGASWAVTPSPRANERAVETVLGLIEAVGALPLYIDPGEHDNYAAAVSHVPLLLSVALFRMVRDSHGWEDASLLAGPGFRDLTRLASGDPAMSRDIMATNRGSVLHWLGRVQDELETIRRAIEEGGQAMTDLFTSTALDRDSFIINPPQRRVPEGVAPPSTQDAIGRMFVGGFYDKLKQAGDRPVTIRDDPSLRRRLGAEDDDR